MLTMMSWPWLTSALMALLALGAALHRLERTSAPGSRGEGLAASVSTGVMAAGLAASAWALAAGWASPTQVWLEPWGLWPQGLSGHALVMSPALWLMGLAWSSASWRATRAGHGMNLVMVACVLGQLGAMSLASYGAWATLWALLAARQGSPAASALRWRLLVPACGLVLAAAALVAWGGLIDPLSPGHRGGLLLVEDPLEWAVFALLMTHVWIRLGLWPMSFWTPRLLRREPAARVMLPASAMPAAWLLHRSISAELALHHELGQLVTLVAASSALLTAIMALTQDDLRALVGQLLVTQASLITVGFVSAGVSGGLGGLTLWLGAGLATTALALVTQATVERLGEASLRQLQGLGHRAPKLSAAYLLAALMVVGMPGTLDFIADELIFEGALQVGLLPAALSVAAVALSGVAALRAWSLAFGGPESAQVAQAHLVDLGRAERLGLLLLASAIIGLGLAPHGLLRREDALVASPPLAAALPPLASEVMVGASPGDQGLASRQEQPHEHHDHDPLRRQRLRAGGRPDAEAQPARARPGARQGHGRP